MSQHLSATAARRIQQELKEWRKMAGSDDFVLEKCEPLHIWKILMKGPETGSRLYSDELFTLQIKLPNNYPIEPPEVIFLPDVPVHPHVYSNGHICLDILYDGGNGSWSPALTIAKICISLQSMLASSTEKTRPPGDQEYVNRVQNSSPKLTKWDFHDDKC
jgi:ubiquitin-protein ligase